VSTPNPSAPSPTSLNLEQQHKRAKDLIRAAREGDATALARIRAVRSDVADASRPLKLADAQLALARETGFPSWPKLVAALEARDLTDFTEAVRAGDVPRVEQLLTRDHVRARLNDPLFDFGGRAAHAAAKNPALLTVLIAAGADVNLRSDWQNGPYTVLDHADEEAARFLLTRGATLTPNAAARLGWFDDLRRLVDADPALVHARGGDGQQPLHEARTAAIADYLVDRGAGVDVRCTDHQSTPAQYALADRPEVCRRLLDRGATPDIFMAARLGDLALATRLMDEDPSCAAAHVNEPGYPLVPPFNIYCWTLGFGVAPHAVARRFGHPEVAAALEAGSSPRTRLRNAIAADDAAAVQALLAAHPTLLPSLSREDHGHLAHAIFHEAFAAAHLMLDIGFDPTAPGADGGTALHAACWVGNVPLVERLIALGHVPLDARDPTHGSTPLGWASFGAVHRRARGGDYPGVAERLVAAGADIAAAGNGQGLSLLQMAGANPAMQEALRRLGAR
jgi:ankyrin repeat protein